MNTFMMLFALWSTLYRIPRHKTHFLPRCLEIWFHILFDAAPGDGDRRLHSGGSIDSWAPSPATRKRSGGTQWKIAADTIFKFLTMVQSGASSRSKNGDAYFLGRYWVYSRSDCCSRRSKNVRNQCAWSQLEALYSYSLNINPSLGMFSDQTPPHPSACFRGQAFNYLTL